MLLPFRTSVSCFGRTVKLKDYLSKADREALQRAENAEHVLVTYQFVALPGRLTGCYSFYL